MRSAMSFKVKNAERRLTRTVSDDPLPARPFQIAGCGQRIMIMDATATTVHFSTRTRASLADFPISTRRSPPETCMPD